MTATAGKFIAAMLRLLNQAILFADQVWPPTTQAREI